MSFQEETTKNVKSHLQLRDLDSLLRKKFGNELIVVHHSVNNLVPIGENFGSKILKIETKVQRSKNAPIELIHLIAKTTIDSDYELDWTTLLQKEIFMYTFIIPLYAQIEIENDLRMTKTIADIVPTLFGHRMSLDKNRNTADKDAVILLDDMKVRGYYVVNKKIGLDLKHSVLALKSLAKFHALGITAKLQRSSDFDLLKTQSERIGFSNEALKVAQLGLLHLFKNNPLLSKYADRIEEIAARHKDGWNYDLVRREPWTTIVHCDFWTNNIMFHKDELGKLDDVKFIDFQTYRFADVFVDLVFFLGTSISEDVKLRHFDEMIDIYYEEFITILKGTKVDLKNFERNKFDEELGKDAGKEFLHCALALHFFSADVDERATEEDRKDLFETLLKCEVVNNLFLRKLIHLLQIFDERGWLH